MNERPRGIVTSMTKVRFFLPKDATDEEIVAIIHESAELAELPDAPPTLQRVEPDSQKPEDLNLGTDLLSSDDEISSEGL